MAQPTFFTVEADYKSVIGDTTNDLDSDPDLGPVTASVNFAPMIKDGDVILATGMTPRPTGFIAAPIPARIDADGRLKVRVDPDKDVLPFANLAAFPGTGNPVKLYLATDTQKAYYWSGSAYVETDNYVPVRLLADTALLELDGDLWYTVSFTNVQYNGKKGQINSFNFQAPTSDTVVNLITLTPGPGQPASGITKIAPGGVRRVGNTIVFTFAGVDLSDPVDITGLGAVYRVAGKTGDVTLVKGDVGLGSVDNTSDANKPVSAAQLAAIYLARPSGSFPWPQGLVGLFDFQQDAAGGSTVISRIGQQNTTLSANASKTVVKDAADPGPFGPSLVLDGATFFSTTALGALDVSKIGDQVTVIVWVKDTANNHDDTGSNGLAFRAGSHNDGDVPSRQYGIYVDSFSASQSRARLTPHIGAQDGPTPGYIYNYDSAHTARKLFTGTGQSQWHMEAMTFDGARLTAYIDGMTDLFSNVTEGVPDMGQTAIPRVVNRNPYPLKKGINRSATTKYFAIGASAHTSGGSNPGFAFTTGKLGGVAVFGRALSAQEVMQIRLATLLSGEAITMFGFEVSSVGSHALSEIGWGAAGGGGVDVSTLIGKEYSIIRPSGGSKAYLAKTSTALGAAWGPVTGLNSSQLRTVKFKLLSAGTGAAPQRLLVKVGSQWWASNTTFTVTGAHSGDTDWSAAELQTLAVAWDVGNWLPVTLTATGATLTVQNLAKSPALNAGGGSWFISGQSAHATAARVASGAGFVWRFTWTGTDGLARLGGLLYSGIGAITAGNTYVASIVASPSKPQKLYAEILWYDASNTFLGSTPGAAVWVGQNTPTALTVSGVAPASATQMAISVANAAGNWLSGDTCDLTSVLAVAGAFLPPYFDGSTPGAAWDGSVGASTSTYTNMPTGVLSLGGSPNPAFVDNALITAIGFLSSGGDGSAVRVTDLQLLPV